MQALRHTEGANLELPGAKRLLRAAFGRSCALESTATGTMLSARRSRFLASASRRSRPLLRREERKRTTLAFSAQPSNSSGKEPRFGEHCYRHKSQCAKKPLLCLREPQSAAAAETRRTKAHYTGILCAALKLIRDERVEKLSAKMQALWHAEDANLGLSRAKRLVAGGFWQEPRFGEDRRNAQCATKPLLCLREPQIAAAAET
ncbi:unnamed protein product [Coccothraustes coccothraustes]